MSERHGGAYDGIARKWLALVERRQESFFELCRSGRWRRYYTHPEFLQEMRKTLVLRNHWAELAGLPVIEPEHGLDYIKQNTPAVHGGGAVELAPMPLRRESTLRPDSAALLAAAASPL
jgi:hypothetical protein